VKNTADHKSAEELLEQIEDLRYRLQVAEETIEAIRTGSVDALAVQENGETKIFTLEGAEQTYRVLVERMSEGAIILNRQGLILYSNFQFAKLVNLPLSEVIGTSFGRFLSSGFQSQFQNMFASGWSQHTKGEFILQPVHGDSLHVHISLNTIVDKGEEVMGMIITNLSEQKELEKLTDAKASLSKNNEELIKINKDLDTFVYMASHDLKAPMLNIEGLITALAETLGEDTKKRDVKEILHLIDGSIARFKNTILDLTEISKVQKGFADTPEKINCGETIQDVKAEFQETIAKAQAEVTLDVQGCYELNFSKRNFHSIIYNLLSNALKYCSPDRRPEVLIKIEKPGNFILLSVKDNGLGINLEKASKMFSMFERLHDHVEGSGIGLYIVKRIMDNAGGKIEVESEVGRGSTFKLYFKAQ
jgi:PAS domain S-box-containing protein